MEGTHPIRAWRTAHKLTVAAAADELEVSKATVSRWEMGLRKIDRALVPQVSRVTGIPPRELRPDWAEAMEGAQ
jgi:transcriptional regulator with XRE-family HTH domain